MNKLFRLTPVVFAAFLLSMPLFSQMPDWFFFRDREGNGYYYDRAFHIRITDDIPFSYDPVSIDGIDFFFNSGVDLIHEGRLSEGLYFLKSIRLLDSGNSRITRVKTDSTRWLNSLYKKHGDRFEEADRDSTLLLVRNSSVYQLVNEKLFYRMDFTHRPRVIRSSWKDRFRGHGVKLGINTAENAAEGYDYMIGVESRIYSMALESVESAEEAMRSETGYDVLKRVIAFRGSDRIVYYYEYSDGIPFCGVEGIFLNRNYVHLVRGICHENLKERVFDLMKRNITDLVVVRQ